MDGATTLEPRAQDRIVLEAERIELTGVKPATCWRMEQMGLFPRRVRISKGLIGWKMSALQEWIENLGK